jgi:hypothetical protein
MNASIGKPSAADEIARSYERKTPERSRRAILACTVLRERPSFSASATTVARGSAESAVSRARSRWSSVVIMLKISTAKWCLAWQHAQVIFGCLS